MGFGIVLLKFGLEGSSFDRPKPHKPPAGNGHGLHQATLRLGLRVDLAGERGNKVGEGFGLLVLEDDDAGEESVTEIIAGGFEPAG
ncbi:MAG: hypothetical protein WBY44_35690, partial [Bryobacteraceae bacterium]